ncbi:hypothetical protein B0H66DRAFT_529402 [Apodospora peruviana]|uniref:Uncharacterized protein n=1 Tax=Apodospora peruviana TaxID=516989 RepID=A0AAE0II45_9PEZI|nr:hypothetical protein B0H66DRAFT_529402 [Apodospora peruviana]
MQLNAGYGLDSRIDKIPPSLPHGDSGPWIFLPIFTPLYTLDPPINRPKTSSRDINHSSLDTSDHHRCQCRDMTSFVQRPLPLREASHSDSSYTKTQSVDDSQRIFPVQQTVYDHSSLDNFYEMDDTDAVAPSPKRVRAEETAPALPQKSALRPASRLLDNHGLKLGGSIETATPCQATPLDVYLSSEEDASSEADDFSDYDYDSSNEDVTSPTRMGSHEDTARVVSVIYSGKPSIVDLSLRRRSLSPSSTSTAGKRLSNASSHSPERDRPSSPASSMSSPSRSPQSGRKSSLLADIMTKKRPPFLNIDPYANGSTYSLELPKSADTPEDAKPPKTPTQILKGVGRTFSLVRKRSRPFLGNFSPQPAGQAPRDPFATPVSARHSFTLSGDGPSRDNLTRVSTMPPSAGLDEQPPAQPRTPQTPVTYNDIVKAAKKNAMMVPPPQEQPVSPSSSPETGAKRGILSGLAARRRSIKLTGKGPLSGQR